MSQVNPWLSSALAVLLGCNLATAQIQPSEARSSIPMLSVCELLKDRLRYDGKVVRIRDRIVGTDGPKFGDRLDESHIPQ
jgi:hypothetical protein